MNARVAPYKGLSAFGDSELDALLFFGRERETSRSSSPTCSPPGSPCCTGRAASASRRCSAPASRGRSASSRRAARRRVLALGRRSRSRRSPTTSDAARLTGAGGRGSPSQRSAARRPTRRLPRPRPGRGVLPLPRRRHGRAVRAALAELVDGAACGSTSSLSIREDALAKLDRFKALIPNLLGNYLRLDRLDRGPASARSSARSSACRRSAASRRRRAAARRARARRGRRRAGSTGARRAGAVDGGESAARIEAPFLQLVMQRLWEEERARRLQQLRARDPRAAREELGTIVAEHLERALAGSPTGAAGHRAAALQPPRDAVRGEDRARQSPTSPSSATSRCRRYCPCSLARATAHPALGDEGGRSATRSSTTCSRKPCSPGAPSTRPRRELEAQKRDVRPPPPPPSRVIGFGAVLLAVMSGVTAYAQPASATRRKSKPRWPV